MKPDEDVQVGITQASVEMRGGGGWEEGVGGAKLSQGDLFYNDTE